MWGATIYSLRKMQKWWWNNKDDSKSLTESEWVTGVKSRTVCNTDYTLRLVVSKYVLVWRNKETFVGEGGAGVKVMSLDIINPHQREWGNKARWWEEMRSETIDISFTAFCPISAQFAVSQLICKLSVGEGARQTISVSIYSKKRGREYSSFFRAL